MSNAKIVSGKHFAASVVQELKQRISRNFIVTPSHELLSILTLGENFSGDGRAVVLTFFIILKIGISRFLFHRVTQHLICKKVLLS